MGVFDFVRDVGAKIGIGESTAEKEAAAAAEERKVEARAQSKRNAAARRAEAAKATVEAERQKLERKAAIEERRSEAIKSRELEKYIADLGIECTGLDVRFDDGVAYIEGDAPNDECREKIILAIGNVEGVAKVDEEISVGQTQPAAKFHTVVSGDTLWAIAEKVYGDGNRYPEIFEANKPMLKDPDQIYPGQVLRCPQ